MSLGHSKEFLSRYLAYFPLRTHVFCDCVVPIFVLMFWFFVFCFCFVPFSIECDVPIYSPPKVGTTFEIAEASIYDRPRRTLRKGRTRDRRLLCSTNHGTPTRTSLAVTNTLLREVLATATHAICVPRRLVGRSDWSLFLYPSIGPLCIGPPVRLIGLLFSCFCSSSAPGQKISPPVYSQPRKDPSIVNSSRIVAR